MSEYDDTASAPSHSEEDISAALDSVSQSSRKGCPMRPLLYRLINACQWIERNPLPMLMLLAASAACGLACIYFGLTVLIGGLYAIVYLRDDEPQKEMLKSSLGSQGERS